MSNAHYRKVLTDGNFVPLYARKWSLRQRLIIADAAADLERYLLENYTRKALPPLLHLIAERLNSGEVAS